MKLLPQTLRWRLQIWYGLLLLIVLCAFGFTAHHVEKLERLHNVDNELQHRLAMVVNELRAGPQRDEQRKGGASSRQPPPRATDGTDRPGPNLKFAPEIASMFGDGTKFYYVVWLKGEDPIARSTNAPSNVPRPEPSDAATRERAGHLRETFLFAAPVDCVLVGRSISDEEGAMLWNATLLAGVGGVLFLVSLVGGGWLIARAIRPIGEITRTAARIADGDLTQRIRQEEDQSELGRLCTALNQTFARLEDSFVQQQRFTSDAAHELRTPLTVLLTQTQAALNRERSAAEYKETLVATQATAQRMRRLIESLLALARFDAGHEPLRRTECDLARVAADAIDLIQPLAGTRRVAFHHELSEARCQADPERIAQVVTNLLTNAIEYNREDGEVSITTGREDGHAVLIVADNGPGIAAEDLPHVFERFYRADKSRTGSASRTGLGLAISAAIVAAHGGTLEAASEAGHGATFTLTLPVRAAAVA